MEEGEKLAQLCAQVASEDDLHKVRRLLLEISVLLEAKEQRLMKETSEAHQD